jgi:hypothetical protein
MDAGGMHYVAQKAAQELERSPPNTKELTVIPGRAGQG